MRLLPATSIAIALLVCGLATAPVAHGQTLSFERTWGGSGYDSGRGVVADSSGVYVTGYTDSFGEGSGDVFLLKYDSSGGLLWQRTWGGSGWESGRAVAVDSSGIYITGCTSSFGAGSYDVVLLKLDSSGSLLWQRTWGGSSDDCGNGVAVDSSGVYVTGYTLSFGAGSYDVFLLKYDPSGGLLWQRTWGGSDTDKGVGVAVDSSGIYVTGYTLSFGTGSFRVVLLKFDSSGALLWQRTWGGVSRDQGYGVAVGSSGIYVTGFTASFATGNDLFLLKFDSSGTLLWQRTWGGVSPDIITYSWGVAADSNVYVTAPTSNFGAGSYDAVLLQYDSSGALKWQQVWGGVESDSGWGVAIDSSGSVYFTGQTFSATRTLTSVSGITSEPSGTVNTPPGTTDSPQGASDNPLGAVSAPSGSEPYAGNGDAFLLKLSIPTPGGIISPVGGILVPANKLVVLAPYLALFGVIAAAAVVITAPWKKREN